MTGGVRPLSHDEAEQLISTRMDEYLDPADSRALLVHLQTCEACRAFAVQTEVLGRQLAALPMLPPSPVVDRQVRDVIRQGNGRSSLRTLLPTGAGNGGLRTALAAAALLTLVSVFLLVRMAQSPGDNGTSIDAPSGGVAQQLQPTATGQLAMAGDTPAPTETPRVVVPAASETAVPAAPQTEQSTETQGSQVEPTQTLDPAFVYVIQKTPTAPPSATEEPSGAQVAAVESPTVAAPTAESRQEQEPTAAPSDANVAVAAILADEGTPGVEEGRAEPASTPAPAPNDPSETPASATAEPASTIESTADPSTAPSATPPPAEPSATPTADPPTATPTPVEIAVGDTPVPPSETGESAQGDITSEESGGASATPTEAQPAPTDTPTLPEPTQEPFFQPTIAPISGQAVPDESTTTEAISTSPPIVPSGGESSTDESESVPAQQPTQAGSPPIVPSDGTGIPEGVGSGGSASPPIVSAQGGDEPDAPAGWGGPVENDPTPSPDAAAEPFGLDLADTVTALPPGTTSPVGRLEFSSSMALFAVYAPDGQLAVSNLDGELVVTLGASVLPVWSGNDLLFVAPGDTGTRLGIWSAATGTISYVPQSDEGPSSDVPVGGDGGTHYFLRTYADRPGVMELRTTTADGSDGGVLWSTDDATLAAPRPAWGPTGILLPTESGWLRISPGGDAVSLGPNPFGYIGIPVVSPGGGLVAYSAGGEVIVAWTDAPGTPAATAPFPTQSGGYAFATSGEEVVVCDGSELHVVSYDGSDLGTLAGSQPVGSCAWTGDTIYFLHVGDDAALRSTTLAAIRQG